MRKGPLSIHLLGDWLPLTEKPSIYILRGAFDGLSKDRGMHELSLPPDLYTESLVRKKGSAREYPSWAGFETNR